MKSKHMLISEEISAKISALTRSVFQGNINNNLLSPTDKIRISKLAEEIEFLQIQLYKQASNWALAYRQATADVYTYEEEEANP